MIAELVCADVAVATSVSAGDVKVKEPPLFFIAKDMDFNLTTKSIDLSFVAKTENIKFG